MARNLCRRKRSEVDDVAAYESQDVHVLAVDDSLIDRKVIERLLKISSCKVTAVDSGRRALQFLGLDEEKSSVSFDGLKVDMIITDYCMPGMTGYELLKKLKGSSNLREIPVVIMSSENVLARIDRCLEEGAEDFIVKPVKLSDVKRLKDYMFGDERLKSENKGINKRKEPEPSDLSSLSSKPSDLSLLSSKPSDLLSLATTPSDLSSLASTPPDLSLLASQPSIGSSCPSPCLSPHDTSQSSSSSSTPESSSLPPPSPPLCSPTRRLKMSNCD